MCVCHKSNIALDLSVRKWKKKLSQKRKFEKCKYIFGISSSKNCPFLDFCSKIT